MNGLQERLDVQSSEIQAEKKANDELTQKNNDLQAEVDNLNSSQHQLSVIRDWVHNHTAYTLAAQHSFGRGFVRGCGFIRQRILQVFPEANLNDFRAFLDERIKTDGSTLFTDKVTFPPAVNFDHTPAEEREEMVPELPYDTVEPVEGELPLPEDFYVGLRYKQVEFFKQRQTLRRYLDADVVRSSVPANLEELEKQVAGEFEDPEEDFEEEKED